MDRGCDIERSGETAALAAAAPRDRTPPELDLDRLVWDPEYREAMRPWLGRAG
jgi:hypothetical protein